jgi:translation initiation factor IF-2
VAKRRIYDIAKEKGLTSQELLERLQAAGLDAKTSASSVEEADAERALSSPKKAAAAKAATQPAAEKAKTATKPAAEKAKAATKPAAMDLEPAQAVPSSKADVGPVAKAAGEMRLAATPAERPAAAEQKRPEGVNPAARRPMHPRGRGPRLDDLPTVVGPGVPLRKGVTAPDHVMTKEELARMQAQNIADAEAARKAQAAAPARPPAATGTQSTSGPGRPIAGRPPVGGRPAPSRPSFSSPRPPVGGRPAPAGGPPAVAGRPPVAGGKPPRKTGFVRESVERQGRPTREASAPIPDLWAEAAEATGLVAPSPAGAVSRVRRGDNNPAKRRVIIDSQAGRKGGRGGFHDRRGGGMGGPERAAPKPKVVPGVDSPVRIRSGASVKDIGDALELGAGELIKTLMRLGEMVTITQSLSDDAIVILAEEFERKVEIQHAEEEVVSVEAFADDPADLTPRAPVVTIMGHVDHGKTSLLDAIRETEVVKGEAGGITQHIGAYQVTHLEKKVTFLDTPGHEAFTAMRARGAKSTDIAVIVVAANDGVMPQTLEAISHAKAAEVPILVAINKMDLPDANSELVKKQLSDQGLVPEAWGGETVVVEVSAKQKLNLDELMNMILLVAEVQELKANAKAPASGVVIEAQLDVGRGPVATVLVQRGTLKVGDALACGEAYGKVKAMFDFTGKALTKAVPSVPVQILGFNSLPAAGDAVVVVGDEREARQRAEQRTARLRQEGLAKSRGGASSLEEFYRRLKEDKVKELPLLIKGDVGGSVEALQEALQNITHAEVKVVVVFAGVGGINESDIMLASASKAVVIGFNVRPSVAAKALAEQEQVDVRTYRVIYKAIEEVEAALVGMLEPDQVEEELGTAEVRQVFHASKIGTIAGCYVQTGKITRSAKMRLLRDGKIVHEGTIGSLKRFADDAREVLAGYECGLHLDGFDDMHEGDVIEAYEIKEVARTH